MDDPVKNIYKKKGVFRCNHPAHAHFDNEVSPYHIMKVNGCWPKGCVEFLWRCRQFDKGHKCPKKFKHVGRSCSSCKHYYEIKNCRAPETSLDEKALGEFVIEIRRFEGWLESMNDKTVRLSGAVRSIRPRLTMKIDRSGKRIDLRDYFITFSDGYLDNRLIEDRMYLATSYGFLDRFKIAPGDELECDSIFGHDRGRIILRSPRRVELKHNGGERVLTRSKALVGRATGKIIIGLVSLCGNCPYCCLVDIHDSSRQKSAFYRRYYCLRGITEPADCPVRLGLINDHPTAGAAKVRF